MLIAISGKMGSGKDTCADYIIEKLHSIHSVKAEKIKFANKVKQIVCLLIGCTMKELDDQDFKNKELPEIWDRYIVHIEGEDVSNIAYIIENKCEIVQLSDNHLKAECLNIDTANLIANTIKGTFIKEFQVEVVVEKLTPRKLLQLVGTEGSRKLIHNNIWIYATLNDYFNSLFEVGRGLRDFYNLDERTLASRKNQVISDLRFVNEKKSVEELGGVTIRINSKDAKVNTKLTRPRVTPADKHLSETDLDLEVFDYHIENDGTIEEFHKKMDLMLEMIMEEYKVVTDSKGNFIAKVY